MLVAGQIGSISLLSFTKLLPTNFYFLSILVWPQLLHLHILYIHCET